MRFKRTVKSGNQKGRQIGFPTINLNVGDFADHYRQGVYTSLVEVGEDHYDAMLHFGPKMGSNKPVLEVFLLDFEGDLYGQEIVFEPLKFIRDVIQFDSFEALKKQIQQDLKALDHD